MKTRSLGMLAALMCASGIIVPQTGHSQSHIQIAPPPPHSGGPGGPVVSGSGNLPPPPPGVTGTGDPVLSGSGGPPPPPPPPGVTGTNQPILSGSGAPPPPPPPPGVTGTGDPVLSGSGGPPPPPPGLTGSCVPPAGTFESLTDRVSFTAASGTTTSAIGLLQAISVSGTDHGSMDVHTKGLAIGTYTVSAVTATGTAPVTLGTFNVKAPRTSGTTPPEMRNLKSNVDFGGPRGIAFPDGFDPFDITSLAISDSNANVLFTADLTTISNGVYYARTPIVSESTGITGGAQIRAFAKAGVVKGGLSIRASGLPASTTYTYAIDGTDIGTVTTGSSGSLALLATEAPSGGTLPDTVDLFTVTLVTVHDDSGNVILTASF